MNNLWVEITLVCAFSLATSDALTKKALWLYDEYLIAWMRLFFALPVLFSTLIFIPVPSLDRIFYGTFLMALPLEVTAFIFYMKALKFSPMSLTLPFLSLTPVFLIIIPYILLGESVSFSGTMGILLIAAGSYTLNIRSLKKGIFEPFISIKRERGSVFMIMAAFIYSFTAVFAKIVIEHSSPVFSAIVYYAALWICLTPVVVYRNRGSLKNKEFCIGAIKASILPGLLDSVAIITNMIALSLTKVAYMIAVKRLSLLIGVFYGYLFFKESGIRERMFGTVLMLAGFILIVLYH